MGIQQEKSGFAFRSAIATLTESVASFWKPMLVAAPLIGTALFFASGTQAQTSGSATPSAPISASGPVTPIASPEAARRKGPKEKVKEISTRLANPSTPGAPAADVPIAPIAAPEAARTGRPKEKRKEAVGRVAEPALATEPVATPEAERTGRPKERDDPARDTSRKGGRPKERDDDLSTSTKRSPVTTPSRGSNLLIPALGGAAAIAAIVAATSGNDRPTSS